MSTTYASIWNRFTRQPSFTRDGTDPAMPFGAPGSELPAADVLPATPDNATYYLRFMDEHGHAIIINGAQLFLLSSFSLGATGAGAAPTSLGLFSATLDPSAALAAIALLNAMARVVPIGELDVLGYDATTGRLLSDVSLGGVNVRGTSQIESENITYHTALAALSFTASYRSLSLQHADAGGTLTVDPTATWDSAAAQRGFQDVRGRATGPSLPPGKLDPAVIASEPPQDDSLWATFDLDTQNQTGLQQILVNSYSITSATGAHRLGTLTISVAGYDLSALRSLTIKQMAIETAVASSPWLAGRDTLLNFAGLHLLSLQTSDQQSGTVATFSFVSEQQNDGAATASVYLAGVSAGLTSDGINYVPALPHFLTDQPTQLRAAENPSWYARLLNAAGHVITVGADQWFAVSYSGYTVNTAAKGVAGLPGFSFGVGPELAATLAAIAAAGAPVSEIDFAVFKNLKNTVSDYQSFGNVRLASLTDTAAGGVNVTALAQSYAATAYLETASGVPTTLTTTYDPLTGQSGFATGITGGTTPQPAPAQLSAIGTVANQSPTEAYFVRLVTPGGGVVTVGGTQLFGVSAQSALTLATKIVKGNLASSVGPFAPLSLTLAGTAFAPALLAQLAGGTPLQQIDVLGYDSASGALLSDTTYGMAQANSLTLDSSGNATLTATYRAERWQQTSVTSTGAMVADPTVAYDSLTHSATFPFTPLGAPGTLPAGSGGAASPATTWIARFITPGGVVAVDGASFFAVSAFGTEADNAGNPLSGSAAPPSTFKALSLTLSNPALAATLFGDLTSQTNLSELDLFGYSASGQLVSQTSFGDTSAATLGVSDSAEQLGLSYGAIEQVQYNATGGVAASAAWNAPTNAAVFTRDGSTPFNPVHPPATQLAAVSIAPSNVATDDYARFVRADGTTMTVGGTAYFALNGFDFGQSAEGGAGVAPTLGALSLSFAQGALSQAFFSELTGGTSFAEIDVLGYAPGGGGPLVVQDSFGAASFTGLTTSGGTTVLSFAPGAAELQANAAGFGH